MKFGEHIFEDSLRSMGLTPRPQQTKLIHAARDIVDAKEVGFFQAGTGTGKSFVLLTAALEAARTPKLQHMFGDDGPKERKLPSVVVCPTNNLIDQYVHQDAPKIAKATGGRFEYLKGRNRYLCTASFQMSQEKDPTGTFEKLVKDGKLEWAQHGLDNSWGCSGDCDMDMGDMCAVQIARAEAAKAEVVITNGHLLVWDWRVLGFTNGQIGLLPQFGTLFVDECHALEAVGRSCLSDQIKRNSAVFRDVDGLADWVDDITKDITEANHEVPVDTEDPRLSEMVSTASRKIDQLENQLEWAVAEKDMAMARALKKDIRAQQRFIDFATTGDEEDGRFISTITMVMGDGTDLEPSLNTICVDSSFIFREILNRQPSVMVSGTVPETLPRRMGVSDSEVEDMGTPFDYSRSTLAISSHRGNDPKTVWPRVKETIAAINDMSGRSHADGGGGTLVLFTSWKDLNEVMPHISSGLKHRVPVFAQSTDPNDTAECLKQFKEHGHAVMGGVTSMWTGVDVPGPALRQVVIFRLPWGVPTLEVKAVEKIHGRQVYVDTMLQTLSQGIGRLIRTTEDTGRVYIADSRAHSLRWRQSPLTSHIAKFSAHTRKVTT